jgi:tetrahydromethanopterin S-methyltransferase subunit G
VDANILVAVATSVTAAASTSGVAITALILNNKRFDLIEKRLDKIETKLDGMDTRLNEITLDIAKLKIGYQN